MIDSGKDILRQLASRLFAGPVLLTAMQRRAVAEYVAALGADLDAVTTYAAVLEAERDNARNDEWLAAISAVQFMSANWWQDCRSEVERNALQAVTEDVISALRSVGPTEYLDVQWKGAEAAMAAEEKAERIQRELSTARRTALLEAAEIAENFTRSGWIAHDIRVGIFPEQSRPGQAIAAEIRAKAEEA